MNMETQHSLGSLVLVYICSIFVILLFSIDFFPPSVHRKTFDYKIRLILSLILNGLTFHVQLMRGLGSFMLLGLTSWLGNKKLP